MTLLASSVDVQAHIQMRRDQLATEIRAELNKIWAVRDNRVEEVRLRRAWTPRKLRDLLEPS